MGILFSDELRGFARSKVMLALWIGLPVLSVLVKLISPDTEGLPLLVFVAVLVGGIGGTLSAVLLSTTVTGERSRHVYDLFLVRPVKRAELLLAKYFAALTCLIVAAVASIGLAVAVDAVSGQLQLGAGVPVAESLLLSLSGMLIASSAGLLFGVLVNSVAVSAILGVYLGNQLSALIILPTILIEGINFWVFAPLVGVGVPALLLAAAILIFRKKSL